MYLYIHMHINVCVCIYYAKLEEITHSQKPKYCDKFINPPGYKFLAPGARRAVKRGVW